MGFVKTPETGGNFYQLLCGQNCGTVKFPVLFVPSFFFLVELTALTVYAV